MRFFVVFLLTATVATLAWAEKRHFLRPTAISKRSAEPYAYAGLRLGSGPSQQGNPTGLFKREVMEPGKEREGKFFGRFWGPRWGWGFGWGYPYGYPYGYYGGYYPFWG